MSLVDAIAVHAARAVEDRADGWLDKGLERAGDLLERQASEATRPLEVALVELGRDALDAVEARKSALASLGKARALAVLVQLGAGREDEARLLYLATAATFEERLAASEASTVATLAATRAREEAWDEVKQLAKEVGAIALKTLIPILLAAL